MKYSSLVHALGQTNPVFWVCDDKKSGKPPKEFERGHCPNLEQAQAQGFGVYFAVNELGNTTNEQGNLRYNANVLRPLACFADFDHGTFEEQMEKIASSPLQPSAFVKSGHGYHVYWFLMDTIKEDLPRWTAIQKSIAHYFGSDPSVNDPSRIMRLPDSWHCKDEESKRVLLERCDPTLTYSLDELATEFPPITEASRISDVEKLLNTPTTEGGRNTAATKVIGGLLNRFKPTEWETLAWPMVKSWNLKMCVPPDAEYIVRATFDSLKKAELLKREQEEKTIITFGENEMIPTVTGAGDGVLVTIPVEDGTAHFDFQNIEQSKSDMLNVVLRVEMIVPGSHPRPFIQRVNLLSGSSMEGLARMLGKSFGKALPWELLLNTAQSALVDYLSNRDLSIDLADVPDAEAPILFHPFLVKDGANLLFGDGGTGKTYFCLRLALSLATGKEFLGYTPSEATGTLFVDYEDSESTASFRLSRLCADPSLNLDPKIAKHFVRYFNPQGMPLHTIVPALRKIIRENNIELILVDSVASACGAEPEKAEAASAYYNALKSLNITSLSIAHVVKTEGVKQDKAFGSVFWHNLARNTWNIQGEEDPEEEVTTLGAVMGERSKQLGMFHRKFNSGPKSKPINMRIIYGVKDVRFEEGKPDYWNKDKKLVDRIIAILQNGEKNLQEIKTELLDVKEQTLKNTIVKMRGKSLIFKRDGKGGEYYLSTTAKTTLVSTRQSNQEY